MYGVDSASIGTWTTGEVVTASHMNTHVRDNFLETAPAKATSASGIIVTTGANSIIQRTPDAALVTTAQTTSSTSYTDLSTSGPAVTVTTGTIALVAWASAIQNDTAGGASYMSVAISGATSLSAADSFALLFESEGANQIARIGMFQTFTGLTAGSNTFTAKYRVTAGTATYTFRRMSVIPL